MLAYELALEGGSDWLTYTVKKDKTLLIDTITLAVDREKLLKAGDKKAVLKITGNGGHGTARDEDDLMALPAQPRHLVDKCRDARDVELPVGTGEDVGTYLDDDAAFHR